MRALINLHHRVFAAIEGQAHVLIPAFARLIFAGTLFMYFWNSGLTKLGDAFLTPNINAYIQIFPRAFAEAGYDPSALSPLATPIVLLGTWSEFILPILLVIGLFTRIAALGMIRFVAVANMGRCGWARGRRRRSGRMVRQRLRLAHCRSTRVLGVLASGACGARGRAAIGGCRPAQNGSEQRRAHRRVPTEVEHSIGIYHRPLHHSRMCTQQLNRRQGAVIFRQAAPCG